MCNFWPQVAKIIVFLKGMLIGAHAVQLHLEDQGIIEKAFTAFPVSQVWNIGL